MAAGSRLRPQCAAPGGGERGTGRAGRRGAWSAASSPERTALGCASSFRPHGRASGRAIEGRHRGSEARGARSKAGRASALAPPPAGQTSVSAAAGGPRALQRPARAGGRGRGGHELCGVPGAGRGVRGAHWSLLIRGSQPAAGNFTREGTAGRSGRCKLSGGRGTLGIAARASGWRWCPRLLCVTSGPGSRVHPARPRGSPPSPPSPAQAVALG